MDKADFKEALLQVMESKQHWAWGLFTSGKVKKEFLHLHFEQEYESYVRDFPVLVARAYVQCPIAEVRRELIENVYEEETGQIAAGKPHPELFLEYPKGLGMDLARFERIELLPEAAAYRQCLDRFTVDNGWVTAAAVTTIFIEGTSYDRGELDPNAQKRPEPDLKEHPLVKHYGLPIESLALTKAHRAVEGSHRAAAWKVVLDFCPQDEQGAVITAMQETLGYWKGYRDAVAKLCGISPEA
ncbi:MAG: iron-containing redox enzyme family protein [Myxococcales bacterium]|nr:MAG: iron-containing redox enzyme family protein [Myxococcales bacterium]